MRAGAKWEGLGFLLIVAGMIIDMAGAGGFGWACLDSRIKCNMIEIIRRCLFEKLLRGLKVKTFSWPGVQQPRDVVQADLAHT